MKPVWKPCSGTKAIFAIVLYDRRLSTLLLPPAHQSFLRGRLCYPVRVHDAESWLVRRTEEDLSFRVKCRNIAVRKMLSRRCKQQSSRLSPDECWESSDPRPRHQLKQGCSSVWRCVQYF